MALTNKPYGFAVCNFQISNVKLQVKQEHWDYKKKKKKKKVMLEEGWVKLPRLDSFFFHRLLPKETTTKPGTRIREEQAL